MFRHVLLAACLFTVACSGDDEPVLVAPPVDTWNSMEGVTYEGLVIELPSHGIDASTRLIARWSGGSVTLSNELARPVSSDQIVVVVPDAPAGSYSVDLFVGQAVFATGMVDHEGPRTVASGGGAIDYGDLLLSGVERYADQLEARLVPFGLPVDFTESVDALRIAITDARATIGSATQAELETAAVFFAGNRAGRELLGTLAIGPRELGTVECGNRLDTDDAERAARLAERSAVAFATTAAGERFLENNTDWAASFVRAWAGALALGGYDLLYDATEASFVPVSGEPRLCTTLTGTPTVRLNTEFRGIFLADYRSLEQSDLNSTFDVPRRIAQSIEANRPFVTASGARVRDMLMSNSAPSTPGLATSSLVRERVIASTQINNLMATASSGAQTAVGGIIANAGEVSWTVGGSQEGDLVTVTYDVLRPDIADRMTHSFDVLTTADELTMQPTASFPRFTSVAVSAGSGVVVGYLSNPLRGSRVVRWTALGGVQSLFTPLSEFPRVTALSADSSTAVGQRASQAPGLTAYRWTLEDGVVDLVDEDDVPFENAIDVSEDGSTILVQRAGETWLWIDGDVGPLLEPLVPGQELRIGAMSRNGQTVVGTSGPNLVRYQNGKIEDLGVITSQPPALVVGVSDDGETVLGNRVAGPFLWRPSTGAVDLGTPPGTDATTMSALSRSGDTAVGMSSQTGGGVKPALWHVFEGYEMTADSAPGMNAFANDVALNGLLVLGTEGDGSGSVGTLRAFADF